MAAVDRNKVVEEKVAVEEANSYFTFHFFTHKNGRGGVPSLPFRNYTLMPAF